MDFSTALVVQDETAPPTIETKLDALLHGCGKVIEPREFDQIQQDAECSNSSTTSEQMRQLMQDLRVTCRNDAIGVDKVLKVLANKTGTSVVVLRKVYATIAKPVVPVRKDFTGRSIDELTGKDLWDFLDLDQDENGTAVLDNMNNAIKVLEADTRLKGHIWFDEFANRIRTRLILNDGGVALGPEREWTDTDDKLLTPYMQGVIGMPWMRVQTVSDAVQAVAHRRHVNPPMEWMESLRWDGVERLPTVLRDAFGAPDTAYISAVGRCFFVSIVARVYRPGCKVDTVPVFEGGQGMGKSQAIGIIGGEWGKECHEQVTSKDFYQVLDGNMVVEIAEMHSFSRHEVERIKGVISCAVDRYRAPYARHAESHPRRTVLVGTTNRDDWNSDETGARRFWPIPCTRVDLGYLRTWRDQLFAEAVARLKRDESWWDVPIIEAREQQSQRRPDDVWTEFVRTYVDGGQCEYGQGVRSDMFERKDEVRVSEVLRGALRIPIDRQDKHEQMRVAAILTLLGWRRAQRGPAGSRYKCWIRPMDFHDAVFEPSE